MTNHNYLAKVSSSSAASAVVRMYTCMAWHLYMHIPYIAIQQ